MILVDTSVWLDHFRRSEAGLCAALENGLVLVHPFVVGEIACGNLRNRSSILLHMQALPQARTATPAEVIQFIESNGVMGRGIGYIDAHLLASIWLSNDVCLWTRDRKLLKVAAQVKVTCYDEKHFG